MKNKISTVMTLLPDDSLNGVLQYLRNSDFIEFDASPSTRKSPESILIQSSANIWMSSDSSDGYFTVILRKKQLILSNISLFSCMYNDCVTELLIEGSNDNETWNNICTFSGPAEYFQGKVGNFSCLSFYPCNHFRFTLNGPNMDGRWFFPIYYMELYGNLFDENYNIPSSFSIHCDQLFVYLKIFLITLFLQPRNIF